MVIDVLRAFTTACYAFDAGARQIVLVEEVEDALQEREAIQGALTMGEVGGWKVREFDFGNSPAEFLGKDLNGRTLIQRTSAGTKGMIAVRNGHNILGASFVCADATKRWVQTLNIKRVVFVATGVQPDGRGDEDLACAEYLQRLIVGENPDPEAYLQRVRNSINACSLRSPTYGLPEDVDLSVDLDRFNFALFVQNKNNGLIMQPVEI